MVSETISALILSAYLAIHPLQPAPFRTLSSENYSLSERYPQNSSVNQVFSDNILLTLAYMDGKVLPGEKVDWNTVRKPFLYTLVLQPGKTFAFHDTVTEKYKDNIAVTTRAHFIASEGFKSDGWLVGDGVCHLASFMYLAASQAGLQTDAPTRHDFAVIPQIPKEYGVSIFYTPHSASESSRQNLYITNTLDKPVAFVFHHDNDSLQVGIEEAR